MAFVQQTMLQLILLGAPGTQIARKVLYRDFLFEYHSSPKMIADTVELELFIGLSEILKKMKAAYHETLWRGRA